MATYAEIQSQIAELQKQAEQVRKQELAGAIQQVKAIISKYGLTAADLGFSGVAASDKLVGKGNRKPVEAKYKDPATGATWSGRGIAPKWLKFHLDAGKQKDDFLI